MSHATTRWAIAGDVHAAHPSAPVTVCGIMREAGDVPLPEDSDVTCEACLRRTRGMVPEGNPVAV